MPPNAITWAQVIDDAVKIGLGALIGGFFAWLVARLKGKSEIRKLIFERRSKILSEATQTFEAFFQAFFKYSSALCGIAEASKNKPDGNAALYYESFLAERAGEALAMRVEMMKQMHDSFTAQSQLMLLGEKRCKEKAEALYSAIVAADASYKFDGKSFTLAEWQATSEAVRDARIAFYDEMQETFKREA
jgi:hypothetical protein